MKIALLHYSAPPIVGGVESVLGHHARLMADAGHQVRIVAGRGEQVGTRISFISIPLLDSRHEQVLMLKADLDAGRVPKEFDLLVERIVSQLREAIADADILIAHNVCSLNKNLALTAALHKLSETYRQPHLILWHHDLAWTTPRYRAELHDGYPWDLLRTAWPGVTQVVVSEMRQRELSELMNLPLEKIMVVSNGVDAASFLKLETQTLNFVKQLDLFEAAPLLLLPVRITPRKNIELALHVLAVLRRKNPRAALVVTGPLGPHNPANVKYFERLTKLRAELCLIGSAHFLAELTDSYLPDAVIADFYRLADALFMPSREEGFGIPVLEAGLAGIPVFCSDIEPLRKLGREQALYFSPDAKPEEVAALIINHLDSQLSFKLRTRVRMKYTWEGIYMNIIAPILENRQP